MCVYNVSTCEQTRILLARNYLEGLIYHRTHLHIVDESLNIDGEAQTVNNYNALKAKFHIHRNKETGNKPQVWFLTAGKTDELLHQSPHLDANIHF